MRRRSLLAVVAYALTACVPEAGSSPPAGDEPAVVKSDAGIVGEYIVRYVDGAPPIINIEGYEPTVTIGEDRIHFQSQCIYADWTYTLHGEEISTKTYFEPGSGMCARGLAPGELAIQEGFENATTIRRINGGLYVEGGGPRLELHRVIEQAARDARAVDLTGDWRVSALDGRPIDAAYGLVLSANFERIWWEPACASQYRDYTIEGDRFKSKPVDLSGAEVCLIGFPAELPRVWSAMDAADTIRRTADGGVMISGNGRSVTLASQ